MTKFFSSLFCCLFLSYFSFGGVIKGSVVEDKNGSPLMGVIISYKTADTINGPKGGIVSDIDGLFELTGLKDGTYTVTFRYITFVTEQKEVTITGNADVVLSMRMKPEVVELKSAEVKARRITSTELAVINEIRTSNSVVSGTSSSQISKTMDRNAADVVKRIPGVSIQDDRFVVIRGLPDRYNTVWLNDAGAPSSEADKKSFSFDIIPSGLIDRVLIFKTPSPELPGDFAGGMVKVYTTSIPEKNQLMVNVQTSSRQNTTGQTFNYNQVSKTDWLGYDDGSRNIPGGIPEPVNKSAADQDHSAISKAFQNDWKIFSKNATPDMRIALAYSAATKWKKFKIGNTLGVTYSNTKTAYSVNRQDWDSNVTRNYDYNDKIYTNTVSVGLLENLGVSFGNNRIEFKNLYSQIGKSSLLMRTSGQDSTMIPERSYAMGYESKATYSTQLTGSHKSKNDATKYTWTLGYNDLFKNAPDLRRMKYTQGNVNDTFYRAASIASGVDLNYGGARYYSALYEKAHSFNHQIAQKIKVNENFAFTLNAGNYIEFKKRSLKIREFAATLKTIGSPFAHRDSLKKLGINDIFETQNMGGNYDFVIDEGTEPADKYSADNKLIASFVSLNVPIGKHITVVGGARMENNTQHLLGYQGADTINETIHTDYLLPSVNAAYNFSEKSLVRIAYGKTLNRPEFREFAPVKYYDFEELALTKGSLYESQVNPHKYSLKVSEIQNFDLRYEYYPTAGEMLHAGVFYKSIDNSILRVIDFGNVVDNRTFTYINGSKAYCAGFELDVRKNLVFADNLLGTKFFKDISFVGNLALSKSESKIDTTTFKMMVPVSTMQGQSPYLVNLGAYYQNEKMGLRGSLLYNVAGARLYAIGNNQASAESIGELPFQSLDLTLSKLFKRHYLLNFGVQNLLDSKVSFVKDINRDNKFTSTSSDREYKTYKPGRYYTIGIKVNF